MGAEHTLSTVTVGLVSESDNPSWDRHEVLPFPDTRCTLLSASWWRGQCQGSVDSSSSAVFERLPVDILQERGAKLHSTNQPRPETFHRHLPSISEFSGLVNIC